MLQRVMLDGIQLPKLYIAENAKDAKIAKENGIPYVRWNEGQDALIRMLLRPVLEQMFPHIKWNVVLGRRRKFKTKVTIYESHEEISDIENIDEYPADMVTENEWQPINSGIEIDGNDDVEIDDENVIFEDADITTSTRLFHNEEATELVTVRKLDIEDYIGDMNSYVNIEILQRLRLMPAFIGDILDCVKLNIGSGLYWSEGYNKRRGLPVGRYNSSPQLPNLVILDVSGSIPRGISATMISLIDTLRTQLSADLIITSTHSRFYPMGSTLPKPQRIRNMFGYGNEDVDFFGILTKEIRGRHYGHVFSFGDFDTPDYREFKKHPEKWSLEGTTVEHVHHYHTGKWAYGQKNLKTGYAEWCHMLSKAPMEDYDTSWCHVITD